MHRLLPLLVCLPFAAAADAPKVVTDIAPVHSLVAQVMGGIGAPDLLLPQGASPHDFALRPSHAKALQEADIVVWIGPDLSPWIEDVLGSLAQGAVSLALEDAPNTLRLDARDEVVFGDDHEAHDHEAHDDHDAPHDHDHGAHDPHLWLDPVNARVWLGEIAATLSEADPKNAAVYASNAATAQASLDTMTADLGARLAPVAQRPFVVFHDSFQYFETHFGLTGLGAISASDAAAPSPARVAELRDAIAAKGAVCVFTEPQFNAGLAASVTEGSSLRTAVLDPLGSQLATGARFYAALMENLVQTLETCLAP